MKKNNLTRVRRLRRKRGIRKKIFGTPDRPRLAVFRSQKHIYAQVIDDVAGKTLVAASSAKAESGSRVGDAKAVGQSVAEQAQAAGVQTVSFDRGGYRFHGRVKALADAAREAGLKF